MITMHTPYRQDGRTNIMAIARRFILTNASRAKNVMFNIACNLTAQVKKDMLVLFLYSVKQFDCGRNLQKCLVCSFCRLGGLFAQHIYWVHFLYTSTVLAVISVFKRQIWAQLPWTSYSLQCRASLQHDHRLGLG